MTRRPTIIDDFMAEYIAWGGPIVTRARAVEYARKLGLTDKEIDSAVLSRRPVPAPADPAQHAAWLTEIERMEGIA